MKELKNYQTFKKAYEVEYKKEKYIVEIWDNEKDSSWDAWLTKSDSGIKNLMFCIAKEQPKTVHVTWTLEEFVELVKNNWSDYIELFIEQYEQE